VLTVVTHGTTTSAAGWKLDRCKLNTERYSTLFELKGTLTVLLALGFKVKSIYFPTELYSGFKRLKVRQSASGIWRIIWLYIANFHKKTYVGFIFETTVYSWGRAHMTHTVQWLDDRATEDRSSTEAKDFSSNLCVQTGSGAHPASCPMGTGGPFPGGKTYSLLQLPRFISLTLSNSELRYFVWPLVGK
jgi:hypothetical protein